MLPSAWTTNRATPLSSLLALGRRARLPRLYDSIFMTYSSASPNRSCMVRWTVLVFDTVVNPTRRKILASCAVHAAVPTTVSGLEPKSLNDMSDTGK